MKRMTRIMCTLAALSMSLGAVPAANAAFTKAGPLSAVHGLPVWYQDVAGLALQPCLDQTGLCPLFPPPFDVLPPAGPVITTTAPVNALNFPGELFYFFAEALQDIPVVGGGAGGPAGFRLRMVLSGDAALSVPPAAGTPLTFIRFDLAQMSGLVPNGTYNVTTPYGNFNFTADGLGVAKSALFNGHAFRNQADGLPPLFDGFLSGIIPPVPPNQPANIVMDNFLVWDPAVLPAAPPGFIGSALIAHPVVKAGTTIPAVVTVSGPGIALTTISQLTVAGRTIGLDVQPGTTFAFGGNNIITPVAAPKTVTVNNTTGFPVTFPVAAPTVAGADAADFIITSPSAVPVLGVGACTGLLASGALCSFDITFTPKASVAPAVEHAARVATITLAPTSAVPPPPVILNLSGTAQVTVTAAAPAPGQRGKVALPTQAVGAGSTVDLSLAFAPSSNQFKVKEVADTAGASAAVPVAAPFTINAGSVNHALTATFMPSGDLDANGTLTVADALKALKIVAGVQTPVTNATTGIDDNAAMILAPLAAGIPAPSATRTAPNIGDVLVILRRVVGLDAW